MEIWRTITKPDIIYEDGDLVVINKPWGLIAHPKNKEDKSYSVAQWFVEQYPASKDVGDDTTRPGMVHRLDRETSGLMVLAKNQDSFEYLKKQFQSRDIKKQYLALVYGSVKNDSGTIDAPMGRIGLKRTTRIIGKKILDSKEAVTDYKVIKRYKDYTLLEVQPRTGRTHQIRVHLKSIGYPVVCDSVYAEKKVCPPELGRLFLHAKRLEFSGPSGQPGISTFTGGKAAKNSSAKVVLPGQHLVFEADMPENLQNFINGL